MRIINLNIQNFKGIRNLNINFNKANTNILGENATGKTTIFDAFTWLLFDKDSSNRKDFNIKTIDSVGNDIHFIEHTVQADVEHNNTVYALKKTLEEKWVKKNGQAEQEFSGHETSYWIDEVPVKKNEYVQIINKLIEENIFKLITNPLYFNTMLKWQERREILLNIAGDIADNEVIESKEKLKELGRYLDNRSVENHKKVVNEKIKKLNEYKEKIPTRIDEVSRNTPNTLDVDFNELEKKKKELTRKITELDEIINNDRKQEEINNQVSITLTNKKIKLANLESTLKNGASIDKSNKINAKNIEIANLENKLKTMQNKYTQIKNDIDVKSQAIVKLREAWDSENCKVFEEPSRDTFICTTCKRELDYNDIDNKIANMKISFESEKNNTKKEINEKGKVLKEVIEKLNIELEKIAEKDKEKNKELAVLERELKDIENIEIKDIDLFQNEQYISLKSEIDKLYEEIAKLQNKDNTELLQSKNNYNLRIEEINKILMQKEQIESANKRIEELKLEEKELSQQIQDFEKQKHLIEEFIKTKVDMLESSINAKFEHVTFKLFDTQINGGIVETCKTLVSGVPFEDVNNAGKINSGLDIINTLTKFYNVTAPVFIDNRESVNEIYEIDSQIINLIVSKHKELKVEVI